MYWKCILKLLIPLGGVFRSIQIFTLQVFSWRLLYPSHLIKLTLSSRYLPVLQGRSRASLVGSFEKGVFGRNYMGETLYTTSW